MLVGMPRLDEEVLARLLFHQQLPIGGHQVNTSRNTQPFAHKRRFQDGLIPVVLLKERLHRLLDIGGLPLGIFQELLGIEVGTGAEIQGFLLEALHNGGVHAAVFIVDGIVERLTGEVAQKDGLRDCRGRHAVQCVHERVMPEFLEATGNAADIDEEVGLDNDERRNQPLFFFPHLQQIQLHAFVQHILQVVQMLSGIVDQYHIGGLFLFGGGCNHLFVPLLNNTAKIIVTFLALRVRNPVCGRYASNDFVRDGYLEDSRDEETKGTDVVHQIFIRQGFMAIAMSAHGLNGNPVADGYMMLLTKIIHLREQVSIGLVGVAYRLMTGKDEETVNFELYTLNFELYTRLCRFVLRRDLGQQLLDLRKQIVGRYPVWLILHVVHSFSLRIRLIRRIIGAVSAKDTCINLAES